MLKKIFLFLLLTTWHIAGETYQTEELRIETGEITLSGTLTSPEEKGPFPTVLLLGGFGPNDRDQHIYGHKTLYVLADHLAKQGIASFRYDKRGIGKSTGNYETATSMDFAEDALAAVDYLHTKKGISKIGLIGHSEGGAIGSVVAAKSKHVSFFVSMAGPAVPGEELLYEQGRILQKAIGLSDEQIAEDRKLRETMFAIVKSESDLTVAEEKLRALAQKHFSSPPLASTKASEGIAVLHPGNIDPMIRQVCSPWFRYFLTFDPSHHLEKVTVPVLALGAAKDLQVPPQQNLAAVEKALARAKNRRYEVILLENHNHLFQTCKTGAISEYSTLDETLSPKTLTTMTGWIQRQPKER